MAELIDFTAVRALTINGLPAAGAKARFYQQGTTTPVTVYTTAALSVTHPVPLLADANGYFAPVYAATGAVKAVVSDALDVVLYTMDPVFRTASNSSAASAITFAPNVRIDSTNVQAAVEEVDAAVAVVEAQVATKQPLDTDLTALAGIPGVDGDVIIRSGGTWARLPKGTAFQGFKMNAAASLPSYGPGVAAFAQIDASSGTPTLLAGFNIASVTDNALGTFTLNFTTAMPTANYCVFVSVGLPPSNNNTIYSHKIIDQQTSLVSIVTLAANTYADFSRVSVIIFVL
jgi:hypothetical protein